MIYERARIILGQDRRAPRHCREPDDARLTAVGGWLMCGVAAILGVVVLMESGVRESLHAIEIVPFALITAGAVSGWLLRSSTPCYVLGSLACLATLALVCLN